MHRFLHCQFFISTQVFWCSYQQRWDAYLSWGWRLLSGTCTKIHCIRCFGLFRWRIPESQVHYCICVRKLMRIAAYAWKKQIVFFLTNTKGASSPTGRKSLTAILTIVFIERNPFTTKIQTLWSQQNTYFACWVAIFSS